jgi:hypothetical protein
LKRKSTRPLTRLGHVLRRLQLRDVEVGIGRLARRITAPARGSRAQRGDRRHRARPRRALGTPRRVDAGVEAVAFEAAEEERAVLAIGPPSDPPN